MSKLPQTYPSKRLVSIALFLLVLFGLLILQFFRIQVVEHKRWVSKASSQHHIRVKEPAERGRFFSNIELHKGHPQEPVPFVLDIAHFHLYIDPQSIPEPLRAPIAQKLSTFLDLKDPLQLQKLQGQFEKKSRSRRVALWLSHKCKEEIHTWWIAFAKEQKLPRNALYFIQDFRRCYPFGKLLGQVLHTVREQRDEKTEKCIPTGGLEFILDDYLQGTPGERVFYRSPSHQMERGELITVPEPGANVTLTINHCVQAIVEEELEKQVISAEAKSGWAVLMDPYTGEIWALAQYPFFHPKEYAKYFNDPALLEHTKVKAITDPYEPGSTMKALTMVIAFMANSELKSRNKPPLFHPQEKVATMPCLFPGRSKPLKDLRRNHPFLNMYMALQKSSNVYMAKMVDRMMNQLGLQWYRAALQEVFGFGKKTHIELTGESPGHIPIPGKLHPNGKPEWSLSTPSCLSIGHNILVNSIQMVRSFAIIANGGYDVQPTLIKRVVRGEKVLYDLRRKLAKKPPKRLIDPAICQEVIKGMKFVTRPGGSARKGDIPGYTEAGKTSTAEKIINGTYSKTINLSTFLGFAPADHPRFVLTVVIDEPANKFIPGFGYNQMGGNCAAPAFSRIGERILRYLGEEPDDPDGKEKVWMEEVKSLKKLYDQWNGSAA
jgi:cell division protein FtsI (penicillin-binding protein 3)